MKNIVACIIALILVFNIAFASPMDMAKVPSAELNFNIFRYISSKLVKPSENLSDKNNSTDNKVQDTLKKPVTMRDVTGAMCVADSVYQAIVDGNDVKKVVYHTGTSGKLYECYFTENSRTKKSKFTFKDITKGSIFYVGTTPERYVTNYAVIAVANKNTKAFDVDPTAVPMNFNSDKISFSYSYITEIFKEDDNTIVILANGDELTVVEEAAQFVYHNYERNNKVYSGNFWRLGVGAPVYYEESDKSEVYMVFAMNYDDETVAICSITTPLYVEGNAEE